MTVSAPDTLDEALSPEWLTAALGTRFPDVVVTSVHPGPLDSRVSTNACFRIEVEGRAPQGLPLDLCLKGYFGSAGHAARHVGVIEASFYRHVAPGAGIRTLQAVYADVDGEKGLGIVITADVLAQGGSFPDPRHDVTADVVAESLAELAKLHAATWGTPALASVPWLAPRMNQLLAAAKDGVVRNSLEGIVGAGIPEGIRDPDLLVQAYAQLAGEVASAARWTVMHGDTHLGNVFLDAEGRPCFLDWQLVQRGAWYVDVSYHIASSLAVEERRRHERDLLHHYLDRLAAGGVQAPTPAAAWGCLQRGLVHGLFLRSITQKVDPAITTILLTRLGTAADDHDAVAQVLTEMPGTV